MIMMCLPSVHQENVIFAGDVPDAKPPTMAGSEPDARGSLFTKVNTPAPPKSVLHTFSL